MKTVDWNQAAMTPEDREARDASMRAFEAGAAKMTAEEVDAFDTGFLLGLHWGRVSNGLPVPRRIPLFGCWGWPKKPA